MKTVTSIIKNPRSLFLLFFALSFAGVTTSCSKDDDLADDVGIPPSVSIKVVNNADGSLPQDFYLDGAKVTTQAIAYSLSSNSIFVSSGVRKAEFVSAGTSSINSNTTITLEPGKFYTIYYTGGTSSISEDPK